jgi:biopolymer transport protein ExbD
MTPMVDLGFLLITFFMLASSFLNPKTIQFDAPYDDPLTDVKC